MTLTCPRPSTVAWKKELESSRQRVLDLDQMRVRSEEEPCVSTAAGLDCSLAELDID